MEHAAEFNLALAIEAYLEDIAIHQPLDREEWEELFDHLFTETQSLTEKGLKPEEAFAVSKMRFGETALIGKEYAKTRAFGSAGSRLIYGLFGFFVIGFIFALVNLSHQLVHRLFLKYGPEKEPFFIALDYGFSVLILGGFTAYIFRRLKRKPYFTRLELLLVPLLGLCMPFSGNRLFLYAAVLLTYTMIIRERKLLQTA